MPNDSPIARSEDSPRLTVDLDQIDYSQFVTEDSDTPVDNLFCERQRLFLEMTLYASWSGPGGGGPFLALTDVGLFYDPKQPPFVPDFMMSEGVQPAPNIWEKKHRSYFVWVFGKPPDVVAEIVGNKVGGEDDVKLEGYAKIGIRYYIIHDPQKLLGSEVVRVYELRAGQYERIPMSWLPGLKLGLKFWHGTFGGMTATWIRWCAADGQLLLTGEERAEQEKQRAEQEKRRARQEKRRAKEQAQIAEQERQRAEKERKAAQRAQQRAEKEKQRADEQAREVQRLLDRLKAAGIDPASGEEP